MPATVFFLWFQMKENGRIWLTKAVQYASFYQVSAYLQALTNEGVASVLVISHLPLVGYLVAELCPGETPPMFTTSAIASVTLDESGNGTFNWQMSPCNLKMAKAI